MESSFQVVKDFHVVPSTHSDHSSLTLDLLLNNNSDSENKLLPKIKWLENKKQLYNNKIKEELEKLNYCERDCTSHELVEIIQKVGKTCSGNKQWVAKEKWFDEDCERARETSFKSLELLRKNYFSPLLRKLYQKNNGKYKNLCKKKKNSFTMR
jgi:hypothetical protein